jgi:mono/diheme cytochrome c family protein
MNKLIMISSIFVLILFIRSTFIVQEEEGKMLYKQNCKHCHGSSGNQGLFGIKRLSKSNLNDEDAIRIIKNGKRGMPSFSNKFDDHQIKELTLFIKSLRK